MAGIIFKSISNINHVRVGKVDPKPIPEENPVILTQPTWVSDGYLGEHNSGDEIVITLNYLDPSNIVERFSLVGTLPSGLSLNTLSGSISGIIDEQTSKTHSFSVLMHTVVGGVVSQSFTMDSIVLTTEIIWETGEDLGTYNSGDRVSEPISAFSTEVLK